MSNENEIRGGECHVAVRKNGFEAGAYTINPDLRHIAEMDHDGDPNWSLPVYRCRLCGCLFSPDPKEPTGEKGDV